VLTCRRHQGPDSADVYAQSVGLQCRRLRTSSGVWDADVDVIKAPADMNAYACIQPPQSAWHSLSSFVPVQGAALLCARAAASEADIGLCPHTYLLSPRIRSSMDLGLEGAVIVIDEAQRCALLPDVQRLENAKAPYGGGPVSGTLTCCARGMRIPVASGIQGHRPAGTLKFCLPGIVYLGV